MTKGAWVDDETEWHDVTDHWDIALYHVFAQTPPGSLNRALTHFQFDTILRF